MKPSTHIQMDWYLSREGTEILRGLFQQQPYKRKQFGFLEKPNLHPNIEEVSYKIFVSGKAGVGKTSTVARFSGFELNTSYQETAGVNVTAVYWPVKTVQTSKVLLFRLEFWDAGDIALKKFDHILPSCKEETDAVLFLFSFTDAASFRDLPEQISQLSLQNDKPSAIVVGTKFDMHLTTEVTTRDIKEFEQRWKIPVIKMRNILPETQSKVMQKAEFSEVALALNVICEQLWCRNQTLDTVV